MPGYRLLLDALANRLERLRDTLDTMAGRLRDAVVLAVGEAVAGAVRDALRMAFHDPPRPSLPSRPAWSQERSLYGEEERPWRYDPADALTEGEYEEEDFDRLPEPAPSTTPVEPPRSRWAQALAFAFEATAWWLRGQASRCSALSALTVGLVFAAGAFIAGPALAGSALSLMSLADSVRSGAAALAWIKTF